MLSYIIAPSSFIEKKNEKKKSINQYTTNIKKKKSIYYQKKKKMNIQTCQQDCEWIVLCSSFYVYPITFIQMLFLLI